MEGGVPVLRGGGAGKCTRSSLDRLPSVSAVMVHLIKVVLGYVKARLHRMVVVVVECPGLPGPGAYPGAFPESPGYIQNSPIRDGTLIAWLLLHGHMSSERSGVLGMKCWVGLECNNHQWLLLVLLHFPCWSWEGACSCGSA